MSAPGSSTPPQGPWLEGAPALLLALVAASAVAFRLAIAPETPATFDEVSFLLALDRYDLLAFEPHFPGYPLAVLLARGAKSCGADAPYALLNAVALIPALAALFALAGGRWRGLWAATLFAWAPLAVHESLRPLADTLGVSLLLPGVWLLLPGNKVLSTRRLIAGAFVLGAMAAAKPDHALFFSFLVVPWLRQSRRGPALLGVAVVLLGWAGFGVVALAAGCGGFEHAVAEGHWFLFGHFTDWGGLDSSSPRIVHALQPLADFAPDEDLGGSSLAIRLAGLLALAALALRAPQALRRALLIGALPYALWLLFGQTLSHPRHALALFPLVLILAARGLPATRAGLALALVLLLGASNATLQRNQGWREGARPVDRAVEWLGEQPPGTRLYAGASARPIGERLPASDVRRVRDLDAARADLSMSPVQPRAIYVLPEVFDPAATGLPRAFPEALPQREPR